LVQVRDKTSEANNAVRTIRSVQEQLADRKARAGARGTALVRIAAPMESQLTSVEGEVYQVKNRSGQDPLNYPIKLNNQIAALSGVVSSAEAKPTRQSLEVFEVLSTQLKTQLDLMQAALGAPLTAVNAELARLGLPLITVKPVPPPVPIS
jgi:hypothetical protein